MKVAVKVSFSHFFLANFLFMVRESPPHSLFFYQFPFYGQRVPSLDLKDIIRMFTFLQSEFLIYNNLKNVSFLKKINLFCR